MPCAGFSAAIIHPPDIVHSVRPCTLQSSLHLVVVTFSSCSFFLSMWKLLLRPVYDKFIYGNRKDSHQT
jgi:hypothetical protein